MKSVKKVGVEFLGITGETPQTLINSFPKLKELILEGMWQWEEWEGVQEEDSKITIMPSLLKLEITRCKKLKALPNFLWKSQLRELIIVGKDCRILARWFKTRCGMEWLKNASQVQNIENSGQVCEKRRSWNVGGGLMMWSACLSDPPLGLKCNYDNCYK
ncbi:unnamed protein product [Prunus armeniaca]|uniref:Uncharacterized protein n=1 Tax=Prunus armeniaca TaxID=36596 RepID=A0A6J5WDM1_PRUAR|nr:unnamed protein product [Prunus armeniaca]